MYCTVLHCTALQQYTCSLHFNDINDTDFGMLLVCESRKFFFPPPRAETLNTPVEPPLNKLEQRLKSLRAKREGGAEAREAIENEEKIKEKIERDIENERLAALAREQLVKKEDDERQRQKELEKAAEEEKENEDKKKPMTDTELVKDASSGALKTLSVSQFKALWSGLESTGSFQCILKEDPTLHKLSDHMRKQGFHVVFASTSDKRSPSAASSVASGDTAALSGTLAPLHADIEIGICNIRDTGNGPWFLARFIAAKGSFSAVMKCQDAEMVPAFVKKFSLAKVLKIDTNASVAR